MEPKPRCSKRVYYTDSFHGHLCLRPSIVVRDGKPYCKQHDPVVVKARAEARSKRWEAEWAAREKAEKRIQALDRAELGVIRAAKRWVDSVDANCGFVLEDSVKKLRRLEKSG